MNTVFILLIVLAIVAFVALIIKLILPKLEGKGVDVKAALDRAGMAAATAKKALDAITPFIKDSINMNILDKVMAAAQEGVKSAEQLFIIGNIKP